MSDNLLFFGDNLPLLRHRIHPESVDLIYLDPPFNSSVDYNTFFAPRHGTRAAAQKKAFIDTWHWDEAAERSFRGVVEGQGRTAHLLVALRALLGPSDMLAYLSMMTPRLIELHRVLKRTGSLYLHCDPTASHYLKLVLDSIFGPGRYLNELSWKRSSAHSDAKQGMRRLGRIRDVILVYTKSEDYTWNTQYTPYSSDYLDSEYRHRQGNRYYKETDLTAAKGGGDTAYDWNVKRRVGSDTWLPDLNGEFKKPKAGWEYHAVRPYRNRYWAYSRDNMLKFVRAGRIKHRATGMPRLMQFADEMPGVGLQDLWTDIPPESGKEYLGYKTQKPRLLMERIIACSSNPGDVVLDPFCGCGTTIAAAQSLGRTWIGIDVTALAISLIRKRLRDQGAEFTVAVDGEPQNVHDAAALAEHDRHQFQWWAVGKAGGDLEERRRGADRGIDGRILFDNGRGGHGHVILSVKSGKLKPDDIRALGHVVDRERAEMGALITLQPPSAQMRADAASAGEYYCPWGNFNRLQIITIEDLLSGNGIQRPMLTRAVDLRPLDRRDNKDAEELQLPLVLARQRSEDKPRSRTANKDQVEVDFSVKTSAPVAKLGRALPSSIAPSRRRASNQSRNSTSKPSTEPGPK